jgi:hypothetical protein
VKSHGICVRGVLPARGVLLTFAGLTLLLLAVVTGAVAGTHAASAQPATAPPYVVPPNNQAYIYDTWGNLTSQNSANKAITSDLTNEGYNVTEDSDPAPGFTDTPTGTTLGTFYGMALADPGIMILETHGLAPGIDGLPGGFVIAVYNTQAAANAACESTESCGTSPGDYFWVGGANYDDGFASYPSLGAIFPFEKRWVLVVSPAGLTHLFAGDHLGIVFAGSCDSYELASAFDASSYLGYPLPGFRNVLGWSEFAGDEANFFNLLSGVDAGQFTNAYRDTVDAAQKVSTLDLFPKLNQKGSPVELSPSVTSTTPNAETFVGTEIPGQVSFDSKMDTSLDPSQAITVSGCGGASIDAGSAHWSSDGTQLSFTFSIPSTSTGGTLTFTVNNQDAEASSSGTGGPNDFLDGNQGPSGVSGVEPNRTDYVWTESCMVGPEPTGRYSGGESQNGNPMWLYVSGDGTQVQDLVLAVELSCTGGWGTGGPAVLDSMNILSDNSFSATAIQDGVTGADNYPTTFTITLSGTFGVTKSGTPEASGTYLETDSYAGNGTSGSCSSGTQTFSATRDSQPPQPAGVGTVGTYNGGESQNGNPFSFDVSTDRTSINELVLFVGLGCNPGDGGVSTPVMLSSLELSSDGSFSTTFEYETLLPNSAIPITYTITFEGHFHGVDSTGASRAAGSYLVTGTFTKNGTVYNCSSNKQWWYAASTGS